MDNMKLLLLSLWIVVINRVRQRLGIVSLMYYINMELVTIKKINFIVYENI